MHAKMNLEHDSYTDSLIHVHTLGQPLQLWHGILSFPWNINIAFHIYLLHTDAGRPKSSVVSIEWREDYENFSNHHGKASFKDAARVGLATYGLCFCNPLLILL